MFAVDGSYDYIQRHHGHGSPPLSVDGQQDAAGYRDHANQYLDDYQHIRDDRYSFAGDGNQGPDLSFSQRNQLRDDYDNQFRSSDYLDGSRQPAGQGPSGNRPYVSSPYGSEVEGSYGFGVQDDVPNQYNSRHPLESDPGYPVMISSQQNLDPTQQQMAGSGQYQPYYGVEGRQRNGALEEAYSDQMSSTRDEVNPLDERFSEQDTVPMDERFSDRAALNQHYDSGQGLFDGNPYDQNELIDANNWILSAQRREENFPDNSLRDSVLRLSIQDNRPVVSPSPYSQQQQSTAVQPLGMPARRSPSVNSQVIDSKWRNPDLREVIDYLNHQNDAIKANAAAYLQHLCYMDDNIKAQTRVLRGIPALVELVNNPLPEVHRAACGALRNLSYGRANDENKVEIKNAGGITVLVRLLRKTADNDIREVITGILWNLSSCADLKKFIIEEGVKSIVDAIFIPTAGWDKVSVDGAPVDAYRSTVFRNASGVLRNVSSDGENARKKLRECEGLVESVIRIIKSALMRNDIDNKSVENCVCLLRNLSYACQEIVDPDYLKKRSTPVIKKNDDSVSCFGGKRKKKKVPTATLR